MKGQAGYSYSYT